MNFYSLLFKNFIISIFTIILLSVYNYSFGEMNDYCVSPPFISQTISPNILIVLDNSYSMCDQAYPSSYSTSQFKNGLYYGYFDGSKNYQYNGSVWVEIAPTVAMTAGTVLNPIANGSFLNWATMRRTEVSKKLLVGGKGNPRSPSPGHTVKLTAQTDCDGWAGEFEKTFDTTGLNLIYPFNGKYKFKTDDSGALSVGPGYDKAYPNADLYGTGNWWRWPTPPDTWFDKVNETENNDSNYIAALGNTTPIIFDFNWSGAEPAGTIEVIVHVRAYKSGKQTRKIKAVLRIDGDNKASSASSSIAGPGEWHDYSFKFPKNPKTGANWTWNQIKQISGNTNLLNGFGVQDSEGTSGDNDGNYIYISKIYIEAGVPPLTPEGGPWNIIVDQGQVKAEGLIDNLDNEVRFGLAYYNKNIDNTTDDGGRVDSYIGYDSPVNMITSIENMTPSTNTPLGETLHEMVRYFRQDTPYYPNNPANYSVGSGAMGNPNIFNDPYAYEFSDLDNTLSDMYVPCAKSFILFLTDGESTQDLNMPGTLTTSPYAACSPDNLKACSGYSGIDPRFAGTSVGKTYSSNGTDYMIDVAYWARTNDMRPGTEVDVPTTWRQSLPGKQNIFLYPIYMFGTGSSLLKDAAIYGGFDDIDGNNTPDCLTSPKECYKDSDGDGTIETNGQDLPLTYYEGNDGYSLEQNIKDAINDIIKRAASSTAVSVLSSSEGSGANLIQSLFYPKRSFSSSTDITWTSDLMNYWYYFDPYFKNAQIREDSTRDAATYTLLDLRNDYITQFYFDTAQQKALAKRCQDTDGDGDCDTTIDTIPIEDAKAIWRAGVNLWWTDPSTRTIKTSLDGSNLIPFENNQTALYSYLGQSSTEAANATIAYVRGTDPGKLCSTSQIPCSIDANCGGSGDTCVAARNRTVPMKVCSASRMPCNSNLDCTGNGGTCLEETHTWKLGDVVSSTPRIMGPSPSNNYNIQPPIGYGDRTYYDFINKSDYKNRQRVFVGANDGMFHAFRLGKVLQRWTGKEWWQPGQLEGTTGPNGIGTESWAFIPKNALPYLQYLSKSDYCHINMVDGPVFLTDASINCTENEYWNCPKQTTSTASSWRSIAIGSMGIGGATTSNSTDTSCVKTPLVVSGTPVGWSSYFALDVTNQDDPALLWEFTNPDLGVSNVGPAIVKVGRGKRCVSNNNSCSINSECGTDGQCVETNGRWFAILASGSTGPIATKDFKGTSDQTLKFFVLDLKTGALLRTIDTGITNAFAGSISSNSIDLEKFDPNNTGNYQDDAIYVGYVQNTTNGGVLRLVINDDINPDHWTTSKVIDNIGPVTTSVVNLLDRKHNKLWLYFAEGRYFHKQDDLTTQRKLFGIQEPCYNDDPSTATIVDYNVLSTCTASLAMTDLQDTDSTVTVTNPKGWFVKLDASSTTTGSERVISNPTPDPLGAIYFLSFAPTSDICGYGGTTYLWALDYQTGGRVTYVMQGKALIQVSTGEIKELDLSDPETFGDRDNRRSEGFQGIPPTGQGLMIITNPSPIKKFMHVQEQ